MLTGSSTTGANFLLNHRRQFLEVGDQGEEVPAVCVSAEKLRLLAVTAAEEEAISDSTSATTVESPSTKGSPSGFSVARIFWIFQGQAGGVLDGAGDPLGEIGDARCPVR